jgi:hypothetical protein
MFFTNVFSYSARHRVCEHAFKRTLHDLKSRAGILAPMLAKHGLKLNMAVLENPDISLLDGIKPIQPRTAVTAQLWHNLDDVEHGLRRRKA